MSAVRLLGLFLLSSIPGLASSARSEDPVAWVEALKAPSSEPNPISELEDYGRRGGALDREQEARLLAPFESLTTEQARIAVPLLLDLLEDHTPVERLAMSDPYCRCNRAWEALLRISYRRIGTFIVRVGCSPPSPAKLDAQRKRENETIAAWRRWWSEDRGREIGEWRQRAIDEKLLAFRARAGEEAVAALEDLALLGRRCLPHLDSRVLPEIAKIADDPSADSTLRERCIRALIAFETEGAIGSAEQFAKENRLTRDIRLAVLRDLEAEREVGIPALIRIAGSFSMSAGGSPNDPDAFLFDYVTSAVRRAADRPEPWMPNAPNSVEGRMQNVRAMEDWWASSHPSPPVRK